MEEITYQGAYIRTMTMIVMESMIKTYKKMLLEQEVIPAQALEFTDAFEDIIL
jgi:hypothetical protein